MCGMDNVLIFELQEVLVAIFEDVVLCRYRSVIHSVPASCE
jgi:hypothetical protein